MPLEIKELHIKMVLEEETKPSESSGTTNGNPEGIDENRLIKKCVAQVLQILKDKEER